MVSIWTSLPFVALFGFSYQQKTKTSNAIFKWKHPQKTNESQNEQPNAFACFGFWDRTDFISKTRTSNEEQQKPTNGKWKRVPKTKTKTSAITSNKKQQRAFFFPIFIHLLQLWAHGKCLTSRAMKNQKEQQQTTKGSKTQRRPTKSKNEHRSWKNQNGQ